MDENTKLIIANAVKAEKWEDGERATDDLAVLREEFRRRLYTRKSNQADVQNGQSDATETS